MREAVDVRLGRAVAVKLFQSHDNAVGRYRFAAEARLLGGLSHPRLVTVYDVCLEDDPPFLVMQLVKGPTLRELLDRGPLEPTAVARVGAQLADVLAYLHGRDVVHRDIKPSNVLVDAAGDCHLTDFGIARALSAAHLTVTGEMVGTAAYLAPEQVTDVDTGPPADIYALGLLLLECLTGHTEYTGTTIEVALARLSRPPRIPDTLPEAWRSTLTAMTATDPTGRPDAAHCAELLTAIAHGREIPQASPVPAPRLPSEHVSPTAGRTHAWSRSHVVYSGLAALALTVTLGVTATTSAPVPGHPVSEPTRTRMPAHPPHDAGTAPVTSSAPPPAGNTAVAPAGNTPGSPPPPNQPAPAPTQAAPTPRATNGQGQNKPAKPDRTKNNKNSGNKGKG